MRFRALAIDYQTEATNRLLVEEQNEPASSRSKQTIWVLPPSSDTTSDSSENESEDSVVIQKESALSSPCGGREGNVPPITPGTSLASPLSNGTAGSNEAEEHPSSSLTDKATARPPPDDSMQEQECIASTKYGASFFKTPLRSSKAAVVTDKKALPSSSDDDQEEEKEDIDEGCSFMVGIDDNDPTTPGVVSKFEPMDVDTNETDETTLEAMDVSQIPKQKFDTATPLAPKFGECTALVPLVAQEAKDLNPRRESKARPCPTFFDLSQFPPELVLSTLIRPVKNETRQRATRPYSTSTGSTEQHPLLISSLSQPTSMRFFYPDWLRSMSISFTRPQTNAMERLSVWSPVEVRKTRQGVPDTQFGCRFEVGEATKDNTRQQPLVAQTGAMVPYRGVGPRLTPREVGGEGAIVPYRGAPQLTIPNEMFGALCVAIEIAQHCMQQQQRSKAVNARATGSLSTRAPMASSLKAATKPRSDVPRADNENDNKRRKIEHKDTVADDPIDRSPRMDRLRMAQQRMSMLQSSSHKKASPIPTRESTNRTNVLPQDDRTTSASKRKRNPALAAVEDRGEFHGCQPVRCEDPQSQKKSAPSKSEVVAPPNLPQKVQGQGHPCNPATVQTQPPSISRKRWIKMCATRHNDGDYDASEDRPGISVATGDTVERQYQPATQVQEDRVEDANMSSTSTKRSVEEMEIGAQLPYSGRQHHSPAIESQLPAGPSEKKGILADKIIYEQNQGFLGDHHTAASHTMGDRHNHTAASYTMDDQSPAVSAMNPFARPGSKSSERRQNAPNQGPVAASDSFIEERQSASSQGRSIATRLKFSPVGGPGATVNQPVGNEGRVETHVKHNRNRESANQAPMEEERVMPDKEARKEEKRRRKRERKEAKRKQKKERKERAKRQKRNSLSSVKPSVEEDEGDDEIVCLGVRNSPVGPIDAKPAFSSTIENDSSKPEESEQTSGHQQALLQNSFLPPRSPKRDRATNKEATMTSNTLEAPQYQRMTSSHSLPVVHDQRMTAAPNPIGQESRRRFPSSRMQETHHRSSTIQPRNSRTQTAPKGQEQTNHPGSNNNRVFGMEDQPSSRLGSSSHAMQESHRQSSKFIGRTETAPSGEEQRNRPVPNNNLVFGIVDQRTAPKASNKFASMPPIELLCSEKFIDGWAESLAELASGRWTLPLFRGENRQIAQPVPDTAVYGRKIVFRDTSLVDYTGVDIELPGGHAIVVHSISNWGADPSTARAFIKSIIRLVSTERFSSLTCVLNIERDITQAQSVRVLEILNATADLFGPSFVQVQVCSIISMSYSLARIVLKHCHANDASTQRYSEVLRLLSDEELSSRAAFLLKSLPTLTVTQSILIVGGQNKNPADQFKLVLGSQIERQKLPAQMGGRSSNEAKRLEKAMIQLSCVLKANLRERNPQF